MTTPAELKYKADGLGYDFFKNNALGREVLEQLSAAYKGNNFMNIYESQGPDRPLRGSSTFGYFAVDERIRKLTDGEAMVAGPKQSERVLACDRRLRDDQPDTCRDLSVVLDFSGANHNEANHLHGLLQRLQEDGVLEGIGEFSEYPLVLTGLRTVVAPSIGNYGLALEPYDGGQHLTVIRAPQLGGRSGHFSHVDLNLLREEILSCPLQEEGKRELITAPHGQPSLGNLGLSRFSLDGSDTLCAHGNNLATSGSIYRTLLVQTLGAKMAERLRESDPCRR